MKVGHYNLHYRNKKDYNTMNNHTPINWIIQKKLIHSQTHKIYQD